MERNPRLRFVFRLCKDFGIDDPICWMNSVPAAVVDYWLAYYTIESKPVGGESMSPQDALERLNGMAVK